MRLESFSKTRVVTSVWRPEMSARGTPARQRGDWRTLLWYARFLRKRKRQSPVFDGYRPKFVTMAQNFTRNNRPGFQSRAGSGTSL